MKMKNTMKYHLNKSEKIQKNNTIFTLKSEKK